MNTKFQFNITDSWWVAESHGHSAFRLLKIAYDIETEYDGLQASLKKLQYGGAEYLQNTGRMYFLTKDMFKISAASIAAYQAMMEGLINNAIGAEPMLAAVKASLTNNKGVWEKVPFEQKWNQSLVALNKPTKAFDSYNIGFYKKFRIPLIHPNDANLAELDQIECSAMKLGFMNGWLAFQDLYDGLGKSHDADSWKTMCSTYGIHI